MESSKLLRLTGQKIGPSLWHFKPIGHIRSVFQRKNGTPRQSGVCKEAKATLTISQEIFTNPDHSLIGLDAFSHVWIMFVFHQNNGQHTRAKVRPPRLNGAKVGVFASRCPYRPNPVGLSLARIEKIEGCTVHLLGVDILDGTPVLDIKPYIPEYDSPSAEPREALSPPPNLAGKHLPTVKADIAVSSHSPQTDNGCDVSASDKHREVCCSSEVKILNRSAEGGTTVHSSDDASHLKLPPSVDVVSSSEIIGQQNATSSTVDSQSISIADWIRSPRIPTLTVQFTPKADSQLALFDHDASDEEFRLRHLANSVELRSALTSILCADPRSVYRRMNCADRLYYFSVDVAHVTCWFDGDVVEVLKLQPISRSRLCSANS